MLQFENRRIGSKHTLMSSVVHFKSESVGLMGRRRSEDVGIRSRLTAGVDVTAGRNVPAVTAPSSMMDSHWKAA